MAMTTVNVCASNTKDASFHVERLLETLSLQETSLTSSHRQLVIRIKSDMPISYHRLTPEPTYRGAKNTEHGYVTVHIAGQLRSSAKKLRHEMPSRIPTGKKSCL